MWARVKGATENKLLSMPFRSAVMFRPGAIQAMRGVVSRTPSYRALYMVMGPLFPIARKLFPKAITTTEIIGRVMIKVAKDGAPKKILDPEDINALGA
jgi:hypothetical protein